MSTCGTCRLCCKLLAVNEISKPRCQWCTYASVAGCDIYGQRPQSCRDFECVWLQSQRKERPLPLALRPDQCGVVLDGGAGDHVKIVAHVDPHRPDAHQRGEVGRLIDKVLRHGDRVAVMCGEKRSILMGGVR